MNATKEIPKKIKPSSSNLRGRPWTSKELQELKRLAPLGAVTIAQVLDRPVASVKYAANRHRISLRQAGSKAGTILGQPRGVSFIDVRALAAESRALTALRDAALDGTVDMARVERLARRHALLAAGAPVCPACANNPQEVDSTGYCQDCHLKALAQAHRDEEHLQGAQRELWRERQQKIRRRNRPNREDT